MKKLEESEKIELKESLSDEREILKTITAFANSKGGELFIGVRDNGDIKGVSIGKNTIENLSKKITESITPPIYPEIEVREIEGKKVIVIKIGKSEYKPHFYKGIAYARVGKINKAIQGEKLIELIKDRLYRRSFDQEVNEFANIRDIDEGSLKMFVERIGKPYRGVKNSLENLKLIRHGKIVNGALLFFSKEPSLFFPLYGIKCAVFKGKEVLDMVNFENNIMKIIDDAFSYVVEKIPKKLKIEGTIREEKPIIPGEALREAIINAVVHRDYTYPSSIFISIHENRVEIRNPGILNALRVEDLYKEHISDPRNPLIAELSYKAGFIEQWGTGTTRIINAMKREGLRIPEFRVEKGFFSTILYMEKPEINDLERKIMKILSEKERITIEDLRKRIKGVSDRTIRKHLKKLVDEGFVYRVWKGKSTYYTLFP